VEDNRSNVPERDLFYELMRQGFENTNRRLDEYVADFRAFRSEQAANHHENKRAVEEANTAVAATKQILATHSEQISTLLTRVNTRREIYIAAVAGIIVAVANIVFRYVVHP
jgi:uncharacterized coiled-coil protein SlyX